MAAESQPLRQLGFCLALLILVFRDVPSLYEV